MARVEEQDERHSSGMVACVRDCHCDWGGGVQGSLQGIKLFGRWGIRCTGWGGYRIEWSG